MSALAFLRRLPWLLRAQSPDGSATSLPLHSLDSLESYQRLTSQNSEGDWSLEFRLAQENPDRDFVVPGRCWVDALDVEFRMDYLYAHDLGERRIPNWRERMSCPACGMNNRQRAGLHIATGALGLEADSRIYMTEQLSAGFAAMARRHRNVVGSEFVGPDHAPGSMTATGVRHEDLTNLSFGDASLDAILTFDVLEHVPDYHKALRECHRVLASRGSVLFSIPFMESEITTRTRAHFDDAGNLVHDFPAAYHGDPMKPGEGVLCFHDFGWDILDTARQAGFARAEALAYHSTQFGYLGGWQLLFVARKR